MKKYLCSLVILTISLFLVTGCDNDSVEHYYELNNMGFFVSSKSGNENIKYYMTSNDERREITSISVDNLNENFNYWYDENGKVIRMHISTTEKDTDTKTDIIYYFDYYSNGKKYSVTKQDYGISGHLEITTEEYYFYNENELPDYVFSVSYFPNKSIYGRYLTVFDYKVINNIKYVFQREYNMESGELTRLLFYTQDSMFEYNNVVEELGIVTTGMTAGYSISPSYNHLANSIGQGYYGAHIYTSRVLAFATNYSNIHYYQYDNNGVYLNDSTSNIQYSTIHYNDDNFIREIISHEDMSKTKYKYIIENGKVNSVQKMMEESIDEETYNKLKDEYDINNTKLANNIDNDYVYNSVNTSINVADDTYNKLTDYIKKYGNKLFNYSEKLKLNISPYYSFSKQQEISEFKEINVKDIEKESYNKKVLVVISSSICGNLDCHNYVDVLRNVQKDYNYKTLYIDYMTNIWPNNSLNRDSVNILNNMKVANSCKSKDYDSKGNQIKCEDFMIKRLGIRPLTMIVENNVIQFIFTGYVDESSLKQYLLEVGYK